MSHFISYILIKILLESIVIFSDVSGKLDNRLSF